MPVATMANPPEHDFAPSWLKIPNDSQLVAKPQADHRSAGKYPPHADHADPSRQRNRHYSTELFPSFPRHPPPIHGYRSRDEKRFRPGPRYHSLDDPSRHSDLPSLFGPLQPNGFLPPPMSPGFYPHDHHQKRGSSLHRGLNHHESHGYYRSDHGRGRYGSGGSSHRDGFRDKTGPDKKDSSPAENGGNSPKGEGVTSDGSEANKDKSALSSQDFPSLSGGGEEVKNESSKPAGAWDKPPGTTKINIGGRKIQLVQKTTPSDPPPSNVPPVTSKSATAPSPANGVSNLTSSKMTSQPSVPNKAQKTTRVGGAPLSSSNSSMYKSLVPNKGSAPTKAATPRKPMAKDVVMRPAPVISNKEKPAPSPGGGASSQPPPPPPPKEASPRTTPAIDIPTPRMVTGKVKKTEKNDFLKELRRTGSTDSQRSSTPPQTPRENGINYHHHYHTSSTKQYDSIHTTNYQDAFDAEEVVEITHESRSNGQLDSIKCNGNLEEVDDNLIVNNSHIEVTSNEQHHLNTQSMELSSSLEAEKRLLQQMGWHEHSDNEEGYAPITEDELNEFKQRSQQIKKNGLSRPPPVIRNFVPHPVISAITSMAIEDAELSSSSDTSDDEL